MCTFSFLFPVDGMPTTANALLWLAAASALCVTSWVSRS